MSNRYLKKIDPKHKQLARLLVGGNSQADIARILKLNKSTVSRYVRDPLVLKEVKRLQEIADVNATACVPGIPEKIKEGAHKGTEILQEILDDERDDPEMLKLKSNVALEFLSRAGYSAIKQVNVQQSSLSAHLTREDIDKIKLRAKSAGFPCKRINQEIEQKEDFNKKK
ncbi:hypothetical protein ACFLZT_00485 [Thermodesulfobacteriota bacterium]